MQSRLRRARGEASSSTSPVTDAKVELVWDPPWTQELLSEAAKLQLGLL
jgi:metal-sulfur cluster biosynthetic enzyme